MAPMLSIAVSQPTQLRCWEVLGGCEVRVRILAGIRLPQDLASDLGYIAYIGYIIIISLARFCGEVSAE